MAKPKTATRDDFKESTKRDAADRVNSLCSFCFQPTKAASAEGSDKISNIGIAAHICAAAPGSGARRYDPSQTPEERSSIENCIWLCNDHAKLIDTDETTYTKAELLAMKKRAEDRVAKALANKVSMIKIIKSAGFGLDKTMEVLQEKVAAGDFLELKQLLNSMEISADSDDLADLHDYFAVVHAFYCDRAILDMNLKEYKKRVKKNYANKICELFTQHLEAEWLAKVIDLCTDEGTKKLATHVVNGTVEGGVITLSMEKIGEEELKKIKLISKGSLLHKLATNFAIRKGIYSMQNADGIEIGLYIEEFVYKQKKLVLGLQHKAVKNLHLKEQQIEIFEEYKTILENLDKTKMLVPEFQLFIFEKLLLVATNLNDTQAFERLYAECCFAVRENPRIKEIILYERIIRGAAKIDFAEVRMFCETIDNYDLVNTYLNKLMEENPIVAERIMNMHQFLFSTHSMFLKTNIRLKKEIRKIANFSAMKFLMEYKERYKSDPAFHTYMAFYSNAKKHKALFEKEIEWLDKSINFAKVNENTLDNLSMLIEVYKRAERYDKLLEIDALITVNYFRLMIASALHTSKRIENIKHAKAIYLEVLKQEPTMEGLCRSLSGCCYSIGEIQEAKEFITKEITLGGREEDFLSLMQLRYETNDTAIDEHIEKTKELQDHRIDHIIGGFYLDNNQKEEAKRFLLRSLLVDDTNTYCMNGYMSAVLGTEKKDQPKKMGAGVMALLRDEKGKPLLVAIHEDATYPKNNPNRFANCNHHKENDKAVEDLLMAKVGDEITYKSKTYKIETLNWNETTFHGFIMAELVKQKRVMAIQGETTEQMIENITAFLREQNKRSADMIKKYNESETPWPTFLFTQLSGKGYLSAYSFLFYENTKKLRNLNSNYELPKKPQFVLSFETIYALAIFDIDEKTLKAMDCLIPLSVK